MIALDPMSQEQQNPPADKKRAAPQPFQKKEQNQPGKNHRDANSMQQLVPTGRVFVIVLRHVVRQTQSAPPCGDGTADSRHFIPKSWEAPVAVLLFIVL